MREPTRALRIVVLDSRIETEFAPVTRAIGEAFGAHRGSDPPPSLADLVKTQPGFVLDGALKSADAAVALDPASLLEARASGVPFVAAVLPSYDGGWAGDLAEADCVIVAHPAFVDDVVERGARRESVRVAGLVPPAGFRAASDLRSIKRSAGIEGERALVLVPCEVLEQAGMRDTLAQLRLVRGNVGFLFDVGEDLDAAEAIRHYAPSFGLVAWMFADGPDAAGWHQLADVAVARPRGVEVGRALGVGAPLVLVPAGRTDKRAVDVLSFAGVAKTTSSLTLLAASIDAALDTESLLCARREVSALELERSAGRVAIAVRAAWKTKVAPRGLPDGLEKLPTDSTDVLAGSLWSEDSTANGGRGRAADRAEDYDARLDRELERLKKRL